MMCMCVANLYFLPLFTSKTDSRGLATSPMYITISSAILCSTANRSQAWRADIPNTSLLSACKTILNIIY